VHLRPLMFSFAILIATTGCETSTDPIIGTDGGGGALTVAQVTGNWSITLQRTSALPCTGALASGSVIPTHIEVLSDGSITTPSNWQNPVSGAFQTLSGSVNMTTGAVDLIFGAGVSTAMELFPGTMTTNGTITGGTITDPAAGFSQAFGSGGCQYTATGSKTG
jgi:hypothetical protein